MNIKMHGVKHKASSSGSMCLFEFSFDVCGEMVEISANECIKVIKEMNILFSKIVHEIEQYASESGKTDYPYYKRISRFDFINFNELYESNLLSKIGKTMKSF